MGLNLEFQPFKNLSREDFFKNKRSTKIVVPTYKISIKEKEMWRDCDFQRRCTQDLVMAISEGPRVL